MIRVSNLSFQYRTGAFALTIPSLMAEANKNIALVGPSGSGKSTLLNLLAGVFEPRSGHIVIDGQPITQLSDAGRRKFRLQNMGMVFQSFALMPYLTVRDNVLLPLRMSGRPADSNADRRCRQLLEAVRIEALASRYPHQLSQGEQQRVAICRALIIQPKVVFADEPTGNLDHDNATGVLELMLEQIKQSGASLIMSTHDQSLLHAFDQVLDMHQLQGGPHA